MSKKTFKYDELSQKICATIGCNNRIKKRLETNYDICYKCFCKSESARGHLMQDACPKSERYPTNKRALNQL